MHEELVVVRELQDSGRFGSMELNPPNFSSSIRERSIDLVKELHAGRIIIIIILME